MSIKTISTRKQTIDYLDGYVQEKKEEIDKGYTSSGLVKSYLLETVPNFLWIPLKNGLPLLLIVKNQLYLNLVRVLL